MFDKINKFATDNWLMLSWSFEYGRYWDWKVSITELLSILVDPSFEYIKVNHAWKLKEACERWTRIHENLEKWNDKSDPFYRRWREWKICNGINIIQKENTYSKDEIRGTIDAMVEQEWYTLFPVDYKSSLRRNEKYCIQVAWYCRLTWATHWWILYLSKDKYIYEEVDIEKYLPIFLDLLEYSRNIIAINQFEEC